MLANDRFNWETPNVIDPGEKPPMRPSRIEQEASANADSSDGYNSGSNGGIGYKPRMSSVMSSNRQKIALDVGDDGAEGRHQWDRQGSSMSLSDVDDDADEEDAEYGMQAARTASINSSGSNSSNHTHDQLPSVEQARLFAATILQESDFRDSKRHLFGGGNKKRSSGLYAESAPLASTPKFRTVNFGDDRSRGFNSAAILESGKKVGRKLLWVILFLVLLVGTFSAVSYVAKRIKSGRDNRSSKSKAPLTPRMEAMANFLSSASISQRSSFDDADSAQYKAIDWLSNEDLEQLQVPISVTDKSASATEAITADPSSTESEERFIQRYLAAVFYYATNGDQWTNSYNFMTENHECNWFETTTDENGQPYGVGITCNRDLQVESILLPSNNLAGTLPSELYRLTNLKMISVKHNSISGKIPDAPKTYDEDGSEDAGVLWDNLEYFDVKYNLLTGTIPSSLLDHTPRLQVLGLSSNQLQGTIPDMLSSSLKTLALDNNLLDGDIANIKDSFPSATIEYLYLNHNMLQGNLDEFLNSEDVSNLIELDLSFNEFSSDYFPKHFLEHHPNLRILDLANNSGMKGNLPNELSITSSELRFLSVRNNQFDGAIADEFFTPLGNLKHLDLENNKITGPMNPVIGTACPNLHFLFLGQNDFVRGPIPEKYKHLSKLRELSMDDTNRNEAIPAFIGTWNELKLLDLANNQLTGTIPDMSSIHKIKFLMLQNNDLTAGTSSIIPPNSNGRYPQVIAIHGNPNLQGSVEDVCLDVVTENDENDDDEEYQLTTDCTSVQCSCCKSCCSNNNCFDELNFNNLEHTNTKWEDNFERSDYSFDPQMILSDDGN
mmetsp:Transcript_22862/g.64719  ORF Transcript_22862/g.64719 Transcript_22862/m.64719 type:complete len:837 (+) Transcript_22862:381-2891(+)|eukprot:CAMPEP_0119555618 /NCGR_PEP_ID=MMETSP1352-20130426/7769_1 /TAXON_ID=265584 /ORGANISM="Stauroneis constricta, Strain CCMP1120" /LENGTH=836 /DNA_ID=CAMNT_0007602413 /DNA_START=371 /DNA_END=2881 /DNA_ORIENTATION=+